MRARPLVLVLLVPLLAATGCASSGPDRTSAGPRVAIVGQNFTEADVVSQLYRALLDASGFTASVRSVGARDLYLELLEKGEVQVAGDYLSSTTQALDHESDAGDPLPVTNLDPDATMRQLSRLGGEAGLTPLTPARAEVKNGYAVTREFAARNHVTTLIELGQRHLPVSLAAGPDCAERPDCAPGLEKIYGIRLTRVEPLGSGTADTKAALTSGKVQLAQVATTDAQVGHSLVLLGDDRHLLNAENVVPLVNSRWLARHAEARSALDRLARVLTTDDLRTMTALVNAGHRSAREVAHDYLRRKQLLGAG